MAYDQPTIITHTTERAALSTKRIFWGAIFAGVVLTLVIQLCLNLLGLSIGAATINPATGDTPRASTLGIGAGIWWVASGLIALFIGGWAAAKLANLWSRTNCMLHGLVVWGTSSLILMWMAFSATAAAVTGTFGMVGSTLQTAMQSVGAPVAEQVAQGTAQVPGDGMQQVRSELDMLLRQGSTQGQPREAGSETRGEAREAAQRRPQDQQLIASVERVVRAGPTADPMEREDVAWELAQRTHMSSLEAERTLERWERTAQGPQAQMGQMRERVREQLEDVREAAPEVTEKAASGVAQAAFWAFFALLLGAISAGAGGAVAAREGKSDDIERRDRGYREREHAERERYEREQREREQRERGYGTFRSETGSSTTYREGGTYGSRESGFGNPPAPRESREPGYNPPGREPGTFGSSPNPP